MVAKRIYCSDPEAERRHVLGTMAASCHTCAMEQKPIIHVEWTTDGDEDFEPDTFVAYCGVCDAGVAWRTTKPLTDWLCESGPDCEVVPVTDVSDCPCPNCGAHHVLPTLAMVLDQMARDERFMWRIKDLEFEPSMATAYATHRARMNREKS